MRLGEIMARGIVPVDLEETHHIAALSNHVEIPGGVRVFYHVADRAHEIRLSGTEGEMQDLAHPVTRQIGDLDHSMASSWSMKPSIIDRPLSQKAGSEASSPKGASNSLWCFEPPALSISKYFSWKSSPPSS